MTERTHDPPPRRLLSPVALVATAATIAAAAFLLRGTWHGDPSIYLAYARNNAALDLFSFNPGEFSSGSTSPLWALLLAVPMALGLGPAGAKALAALVLASAGALCVLAARAAGARPAGAALASAAVVALAARPTLLLYESGLTLLLVAALAMAWLRVADGSGADRGAGSRAWAGLTLCWALLPLARPDAVILVALGALGLFLHRPARWRPVATALLVASVPSLLYFGGSWLLTGHASSAAACRGFALREQAASLLGIPYAIGGVITFFEAPLVLLAGFSLVARGSGSRSVLWTWCWLSVGAYLALITFVSPVAAAPDRYLLPLAPLLAASGAGMIDRLLESPGTRGRGHSPRDLLVSVGIALALAGVPLLRVVVEARAASRLGYAFETIMEAEAVARLHDLAPDGATVLAYEVQLRYGLRPGLRVLSLDGITDGKVAPYLASGDMGAFLRAERPAFWIVNDAVFYRPFLARSLLRRVADALRGAPAGASYEVEGLRFEVLAVNERPAPEGFAAWRQIVAIQYADR